MLKLTILHSSIRLEKQKTEYDCHMNSGFTDGWKQHR